MTVNVIFYQDPNPEDCNVFGVFNHKLDAKNWLENHDWKFDTDCCIWIHNNFRGFIEILERELF